VLTTHGVPPPQRPPQPVPKSRYPTKPPLALRVRAACKAPHPDIRVHCLAAAARYGPVSFVEAASAIFGDVHVRSHIRSPPNMRAGPRAQHGADSWATPPGTPHPLRIRGGEVGGGWGSRARVDVCSHPTKRCLVAITAAAEETCRDLLAADLSWRTRDLVQGPSRRWLVEVFMQDWQSSAGWSPLPSPAKRAHATA